MKMNIVRVDPRTDPVWQLLVDRTPSSVFHSPAWIQVLTDTYGWEASAFVVLDDRGDRHFLPPRLLRPTTLKA